MTTGRAELAMAWLRVLLVPLVAVGAGAVDHPGGNSDAFVPLLIAVSAWTLVVLVVHVRAVRGRTAWVERAARVEPVIDLAAITALTYSSGGPYSQTRLAFFALPLVAAFRLRPRLTAAWAGAAIAAYVLTSLPHPATRSGADVDVIIVTALFLAWAGAGAVVLAAALGQRDRQIRAQADQRGRLVAQALDAEERERGRLAELLHDHAIQNLLLARQELHDHHRRHDEPSYERADAALATTVEQLRGEIFDLHPYVLDHAGLHAALSGLADNAERRSDARVHLDIGDVTLPAEQQHLLLSVARELLANAAQHAHARTITLRLTDDAGGLTMTVSDDGRGLTSERRSRAITEGHIGMATSAERICAAGGTLDVSSAPGDGTTITVRLPRT